MMSDEVLGFWTRPTTVLAGLLAICGFSYGITMFLEPTAKHPMLGLLLALASPQPLIGLIVRRFEGKAQRAKGPPPVESTSPRALLERMVAADETQPRGFVDAKALACKGTLDEVLAHLEQHGCIWTRLAGNPRGELFKAFEPARSYFAICDSKQGYDYRSGDSYLTWDYWVIIRIDRTTYGCEADRLEVLD